MKLTQQLHLFCQECNLAIKSAAKYSNPLVRARARPAPCPPVPPPAKCARDFAPADYFQLRSRLFAVPLRASSQSTTPHISRHTHSMKPSILRPLKPLALPGMSALALTLALALALAFFHTGCSSAFTTKSDRHAIVPLGARGAEAYWTPTDDDIRRLEEKLGRMFHTADARITGLPDNIPPYPFSEYCIRYTGAGPASNRYILGEAMHKTLPDAAKFLATPSMPLPDKGDARYFTVMYDMQTGRVTAVRFLTQQ